ncbi:MAG: glutathione S-transferase family protein [Rhodobacteraceae bacterium]|nr:glutathione S-transferase family protein [Paracoccaceae bacterium]
MLVLETFPPALGILSPSQFCLKADALLTLSGLPFARETALPQKAPLGKLPVLRDGAERVADSGRIERHLRLAHGFDADAGLDARARGEAQAYRCMLEEHLYFIMHHARWIARPEITREVFLGRLPEAVREAAFAQIQAKMARDLEGQGLGRHAEEDLLAFGRADLEALALRLGEGPFFFGEIPHSIDTTLFGFLENLVTIALDGPLEAAARAHPELVAFCTRFRERVYGG